MSFPNKTPYGLKASQVNYVVATLKLEGLCDYRDGILWVPNERSAEVYELVKNYKELKAKSEGY